MQLITNTSKLKTLVLAVLTASLMITWDRYNSAELPHFNYALSPSYQATDMQTKSAQDNLKSMTVWNSIRQEFSLDHKTEKSQVQIEIRRLLADQNKFYQILNSAAPYIYYIHKQTQRKGLPGELALIPFIESEFNPNDHSNKGATGLWQLMAGTAHELGVRVKAGYDGRRNVVASTKAALAYFQDLGNNFKGNWYLAIAAYNCGQGKVESATRRTGSDSFWNLPLPKETKYYVPKLLAVAEIIEHPEKYGVQLPPVIDQPYFTELTTDKPLNVEQVAKSSGLSIKTLQTLNPDYYKKGKTPQGKTTKLLVPINKLPIVKANLQQNKVKVIYA